MLLLIVLLSLQFVLLFQHLLLPIVKEHVESVTLLQLLLPVLALETVEAMPSKSTFIIKT